MEDMFEKALYYTIVYGLKKLAEKLSSFSPIVLYYTR